MKINQLLSQKIQQIYKQQQKSTSVQKKGATREDKMQISGKAREIRELEKHLSRLPEVRQEKIDQIKTAIAKNEYHVSTRDIAEKILNSQEQE